MLFRVGLLMKPEKKKKTESTAKYEQITVKMPNAEHDCMFLSAHGIQIQIT